MRALRVLVGAGVALSSATAAAGAPAGPSIADTVASDTHPLHRLVARERGPARYLERAVDGTRSMRTEPRVPFIRPRASALDCEHAKHDIRLNPSTGATQATLELHVRADGRPLSSLGFTIDEGLTVSFVEADGRFASLRDEVYPPARVARVDFEPALEPGESTVVRIAYGGTLACGAFPESGGFICTKGRDFSYFAHQSVFPYLFDPAAPYAATFDGLTREIVLRVPPGTDVVATGEKTAEVIDGDGAKATTWSIHRPLSRSLGMYVFAGKLGLKDVPGRAVPTTLVFPAPEQPIDRRLASWSGPVLSFVERVGGTPLPFQRGLSLVRLPADVGDPGTATFGMTLLSESYARAGDLMHEETWAHENAHLFWGIVVPESDSLESRMMSEGLATLAELDYTYARHFQGEDRDLYLARRFVPIGLDLRTFDAELPAIQLPPGAPMPDDFRTQLYTLWAYYKTSATLDHLRATIGDDVFARGLTAYVERCSYVGCRPGDFRAVLEEATGKTLAPFFSRWVTGTSRPAVTIGFDTSPGGADVELTKADDRPMTLELWVRLDDGGLVKRRVDLAGRSTRVRLDVRGGVRSVAASPRHDVLVDARSATRGDLDFDGDADGIDILRCARLVGKRYETKGALGLWNVSESFDPRCDLDGDFDIDEHDLDDLAESFGTMREAR